MNTHRERVAATINEHIFLTDAGMETEFIFNQNIDLPHFASFDLLSTDRGKRTLENYYQAFFDLAAKYKAGFILESPTWRANFDWGKKLGYSADEIADVNRQAISFMARLREQRPDVSPILISGNIGPRGDGYSPDFQMTTEEAKHYHQHQISAFVDAQVDLISAFTLNYFEEALGITQAASEARMPLVISYTLEIDGKLPTGQTLEEAITALDAATGSYPLYYMINCAHPSHFESMLASGSDWRHRIRGIRSNASKCSHAELNEATELDDGNPQELGTDYVRLKRYLPALKVYGGCCGTDVRHVHSIAQACLA